MRLKEIEERKLEIRSLLEGKADIDLAALEVELKSLESEKTSIEKRNELLKNVEVGKVETRAIEKEVARPQVAQNNEKAEEKRAAFQKFLKTGDFAEYRAIQMDNPTQAGYLVAPEMFVNELIKTINNNLFFRNMARVLPALEGAQSLGYPKRTTAMTRAAWGTEIAAPTADTALAFGKREFKPKPMTAEILVSKTLIKNSRNVEQIINDEFAFAFGETAEIAYMTGDGAGKPLGVFTASSDGISTSRDVSTGNTATEVKFDCLIKAVYSIKQQYHNNLQWIFHRDVVEQIRKLKDSNGQYIWQQSLQQGQPDRLLGYPVNISEYAPNTMTTGLYVGILGDFNNYWIADSMAFEMQALMELYARTNQVDYIGRMETDGAPVVEEAFARIKLA